MLRPEHGAAQQLHGVGSHPTRNVGLRGAAGRLVRR